LRSAFAGRMSGTGGNPPFVESDANGCLWPVADGPLTEEFWPQRPFVEANELLVFHIVPKTELVAAAGKRVDKREHFLRAWD
jgi:hypothetical protein